MLAISKGRRGASGVALLMVALCACVDASAPQRGDAEKVGRGVVRVDQSSLATVRDGEIDQSDSHIALEAVFDIAITVASDTLIRDPFTGNLVYEYTIPGDRDSLHLEAGYDAAGRTRINTYKLGPLDSEFAPNEQVYATRSIDASHTVLDGLSAPLVHHTENGVPSSNAMNLLGNTADIPIDHLVSGGGGGGGPNPPGDGDYMMVRLPLVGGAPPDSGERQFVDARGRLHRERSVVAPSATGMRVTLDRTYEVVGDHWRLREVSTRSVEQRGPSRIQTGSTTRLRRVRSHFNRAKADERARRRRGRRVATSTADLTINPCVARLVMSDSASKESRTADCGRSGGGPSAFPVRDLTPTPCEATWERQQQGERNVILVHGIMSNACTWNTVAPQMPHVTGNLTGISTNSLASYGVQADSVLARTRQSGGSATKRYVAVGHSQGGVIGRLAAQRDRSMMRGAITIGSPNRGALFAERGPSFLMAAGVFTYAVLPGIGTTLSAALGYPGGYAQLSRCPLYAATCDARPSSLMIQGINSAAPIRGASIIHHASNKWLLFRIAADFQSPGSGSSAARDIGSSYGKAVRCAVVSSILAVVWHPLAVSAYACTIFVAGVAAMDRLWQWAVSGGATSDGFIPVSSQEWPGGQPNQLLRIPEGSSHAAELVDPRTQLNLTDAFAMHFSPGSG